MMGNMPVPDGVVECLRTYYRLSAGHLQNHFLSHLREDVSVCDAPRVDTIVF